MAFFKREVPVDAGETERVQHLESIKKTMLADLKDKSKAVKKQIEDIFEMLKDVEDTRTVMGQILLLEQDAESGDAVPWTQFKSYFKGGDLEKFLPSARELSRQARTDIKESEPSDEAWEKYKKEHPAAERAPEIAEVSVAEVAKEAEKATAAVQSTAGKFRQWVGGFFKRRASPAIEKAHETIVAESENEVAKTQAAIQEVVAETTASEAAEEPTEDKAAEQDDMVREVPENQEEVTEITNVSGAELSGLEETPVTPSFEDKMAARRAKLKPAETSVKVDVKKGQFQNFFDEAAGKETVEEMTDDDIETSEAVAPIDVGGEEFSEPEEDVVEKPTPKTKKPARPKDSIFQSGEEARRELTHNFQNYLTARPVEGTTNTTTSDDFQRLAFFSEAYKKVSADNRNENFGKLVDLLEQFQESGNDRKVLDQVVDLCADINGRPFQTAAELVDKAGASMLETTEKMAAEEKEKSTKKLWEAIQGLGTPRTATEMKNARKTLAALMGGLKLVPDDQMYDLLTDLSGKSPKEFRTIMPSRGDVEMAILESAGKQPGAHVIKDSRASKKPGLLDKLGDMLKPGPDTAEKVVMEAMAEKPEEKSAKPLTETVPGKKYKAQEDQNKVA